jgi:hypothetical protein
MRANQQSRNARSSTGSVAPHLKRPFRNSFVHCRARLEPLDKYALGIIQVRFRNLQPPAGAVHGAVVHIEIFQRSLNRSPIRQWHRRYAMQDITLVVEASSVNRQYIIHNWPLRCARRESTFEPSISTWIKLS